MQEFIAFNEQRAEIYWWMSSLLARELTTEDLMEYHGDEMLTFLSGLGMTPALQQPVESFRGAINRLKVRENAQLELAADFCGLFLSTPKSGALPYASLYVGKTGLLNDKPAQDMNTLMAQYNIAQRKEFNEPADHIAVELDFMGHLIIQANHQQNDENREKVMQAQLSFVNNMLLNWLPIFAQACQSRDHFGFYSTAVDLLVAFCQLDAVYLAGDEE